MNFLSTELLMNAFGIIVAILVLGILVAVHEAGHLLMAKWSNIRVDTFSVGMGKPIWGKQIGETFYQIGQLPFGGYCGFGASENAEEEDTDPRGLMNSPLWARLLTVIGGSLFNIIFAYLVLVVMYTVGFNDKQLSNIVAVPESIMISGEKIPSPAYQAGLRDGDQIIQINDQNIDYFIQIPTTLSQQKSPHSLSYVRNNTTNTVEINAIVDRDTGLDLLGIAPVQPSIISEIVANSPAEQAGLKEKDKIIAINGNDVAFFYQIQDFVSNGQALNLTIERQKQTNQIQLTPMLSNGTYLMGVKSEFPHQISVRNQAKHIGEAFVLAYQNISGTVSQILVSLQKLFTGQVDVQKNLSGPVRIVSITGEIAQTFEFALLMKFMVMLSLALAVFNLLPFPGLDGGAIILQTARSIFKDNQKASKFIGYVENFGVMLLLVLAVFILFNDIKNIFL